ncbi:MAG: tetratricopeptide repeat protein [Acidobacteriota bacterium]
MPESQPGTTPSSKPRRPRRKPVGPRLKPVLNVVFGLFALLGINAVYLLGVRLLEAATGETYQNWFYMNMFLVHLVLGLLFVVPTLLFAAAHMRNTYNRPNRRAVKVGYGLLVATLVLLVSGLILTRFEGILEVRDPSVRRIAWWLHVLAPFAAGWLFVIHRLAGKRINWQMGKRWAAVAAVLGGAMLLAQSQDPRSWNQAGPESGEQYFFPSLARTATGDFIPAEVLQNDAYCQECHADTHADWANSVHRWSSFNNPPYAASVAETRQVSMERDGTVQAARFCAGCHDPVPFFSGEFDDPNYDFENARTGQAGITCTACHAITNINSVRGNADYTIEEPVHYPFAFSDNAGLRWVNEQLIKAKPELHKKTFLKPLHESPEFCGSCHKVHLPEELNEYKFLRGQNHYDTYHLSGVSGHGVQSFYYPAQAEHNCSGCHMPLADSTDFGAKNRLDNGQLQVRGHLFPSANTAIPKLVGLPDWVVGEHEQFTRDTLRVDLFGVREGGSIDGELTAPLRPQVPSLVPGESYLLETVIRTLKVGHPFTQGTSDSNQVWLDIAVRDERRTLGRSGGMNEEREVDPWSHFVNSYVLDRDGNRINRRNAQDIFVPLYNHQIPPGAADVVHYRLDVPPDAKGSITVDVALRYRKFDMEYMRYVYGEDFDVELPIMEIATDRVVFPIAGSDRVVSAAAREIPEWQRWNDYGIGLLRKGGKSSGQLRQAEEAFAQVEALGRPDGPLNLARVYLQQGTVRDKAVAALERAASFDPPAPAWSVAWFSGLVDKQNGFLDAAIERFEGLVAADTQEMRDRGFDFSQDYNLLNELGQTLFERAKQERGEARSESRRAFLERAAASFEKTLTLDPENVSAHFNLDLIERQLGRPEKAAGHREKYLKYRPDDNARGRAIAIARSRDAAADHAAEAIVIYDLQRPGAYQSPFTRAPRAASAGG